MTTPAFRFSQLPLASLLLLFASAPAMAQSGRGPGFHVRAHGGFSPSTELENNVPAEVTVYRAGLDLEYDFDLGNEAALTIGTGSEAGTYDFDAFGPVSAATGGAFANYAIGSLYGSYSRQLDQQTGLLAQVRVMSGIDIGASFRGSFTFAAVGGATHKVDDDLTIGLAVGVQTRLDDHPIIYPVPLVEWKIDDRWRLSSDYVTSNASGFEDLSGLRLYYQASEVQNYYVGLGWQIRQYRLDNDSYDAFPGGALLDNRIALYGGTIWQVQHNTALYLNLGYNLRQEFDANNVTGRNPLDIQTDPAPFVSLGVEFDF